VEFSKCYYHPFSSVTDKGIFMAGRKPRRGADKVFAPGAAQLTLTTSAPNVTIGLTIRGLAERLAPIAPDVDATVQQIRHWTREGLLLPIQDTLHSGPGVHRVYNDDAVYEGAILSVVANAGLPISGSQVLADAMAQVRLEVAKRKAGKGKKNSHLIIMRTPLGQTAAAVIGEGERFTGPRGFKVAEAVMSIDIDLEKLFAQVGHGRS
jgi:DNA-binding transcriptional MerR regulator